MNRLLFSEIRDDSNEIYLEKDDEKYDEFIEAFLVDTTFEKLKFLAYEKKDGITNAIFYLEMGRKKVTISLNAEIIKTYIRNLEKNYYDEIFAGYDDYYNEFMRFKENCYCIRICLNSDFHFKREKRIIKDDEILEYYKKNARYISELLGVEIGFEYIELLKLCDNIGYSRVNLCEYVFRIKNTEYYVSSYTNNLNNSYDGFNLVVNEANELLTTKSVKRNKKLAKFKDNKLVMDIIYDYEADITKKQLNIFDFL